MAKISNVLLVLALLSSVSLGLQNDPCYKVENCHPHQSGLCQKSGFPLSCDHQLRNEDYEHGNCSMERIDPTECYIEPPYHISEPNELPFDMQMYFYKTWMESRATTNLTFSSPTWQSVKFRYQGREDQKKVVCREFFLYNLTLPMNSSLMWDCPFFHSAFYFNRSFDLSVITSEGKGGKYAFRAPEKERFDPINTKLEDWQMFFYLHMDHVQRSANLPVTIQLAPFANLTYNISLFKCIEDDHLCSQRSTLSSIYLQDPEKVATNVDDAKQVTELLPSSNSPAIYAVSVQIISSECPEEGCYVSISPVFEIKESQIALWPCVAFSFILIFAFAFTVTLHHRIKENRRLLLALKHNPPRVLLVYLPENQHCLELVRRFAEFLKERCYVHPHVIDDDVASRNPNSWISEHMNQANRIVFIVPGNPNGNSITPIRDQWETSLNYLSGHHFSTYHVTNRVAVVLLPFSADVPYEVANVQRFYMIKEMTSFVTWIHDGSWMDKKLVWGPLVRSTGRKETNICLTNLEEFVDQASQETKCHKGVGKVLHRENHLMTSDLYNDTTDSTHNNDSQHETSESEKFNDTVLPIEPGAEFDPAIPGVADLLIPVDDSDQSSIPADDSDQFSIDMDESLFL